MRPALRARRSSRSVPFFSSRLSFQYRSTVGLPLLSSRNHVHVGASEDLDGIFAAAASRSSRRRRRHAEDPEPCCVRLLPQPPDAAGPDAIRGEPVEGDRPAGGEARLARGHGPGAAPQDRGEARRSVELEAVFPDVAQHVVEPERVRFPAADVVGRPAAVPLVPGRVVQVRRRPALLSRPSRQLPLLLGRQPEDAARVLRQPLAVSERAVPADVRHRTRIGERLRRDTDVAEVRLRLRGPGDAVQIGLLRTSDLRKWTLYSAQVTSRAPIENAGPPARRESSPVEGELGARDLDGFLLGRGLENESEEGGEVNHHPMVRRTIATREPGGRS